MKLNNKILYITTVGVLSALSPTNAQTFYQCLPITCKDGQYIDGNTCKNCPAGTFQKGNNKATSCSKCPAGTYTLSTGNTNLGSCIACPDYHWSNAGDPKCGRIQIPTYYFYGENNSYYKKKFLLSGETYTFNNDLFGGDPIYKQKKSVGLGQKSMTWFMEDSKVFLDCKKLPCENLPNGHNGRSQRILYDGTIQYRFTDINNNWNNGEKVIW